MPGTRPTRTRSSWLPATGLLALFACLLLLAAPPAPLAAAVYDETPVVSPDTAKGDSFGTAVALDGDTLVVGAQWASPGGREKAGVAVVFRRTAAGGWTQVRRLAAADGQPFDQFGAAVALDGDLLAVGATLANVAGAIDQGAVYLFERNAGGPNAWGQVTKLTIPAFGGNFDNFGDALAVQGDEVFVGAKDADAGGANRRGAVYVFRRGDGWANPATLTDPDGRESDSFGAALAVEGDWLLIGAERADVSGFRENDGAALLFRRSGPGGPWTFERRLTASDADGSSRFGAAVALRGGRALVGAPAVNRGSDFSTGAAYLYEQDRGGAGTWGEAARLADPNGRAFDGFGTTVALSGGAAYVGSYQADVDLADEGAVYLFEPSGGVWAPGGRIVATDGTTGDNFALALAHAADTLVVGAPLAAEGGGKAYAYTPGAPPQRSFTYLPLTFNPFFVPTGRLVPGGVVTGPEGVRLGAPAGSFDGELPISIDRVGTPPEPLGAPATPVGNYYRLSAAREMVQPLDKAFILGLPIPPGADRARLAVATLGSAGSLLHDPNPTETFWSLTPAVLDEDGGLVLAAWPHLSAEGETVVVVEHPGMSTAPATATGRSTADSGFGLTANFLTVCPTGLACKDTTLQAFAEALQRNYVDFFIYFSYPAPRLHREGADLSLDPPNLGLPNGRFLATIKDKASPGCTPPGGTARLGAYDPNNGKLWICLPPNGDLDDRMLEATRHEVFHAFQFAFDAFLEDSLAGESENWIVEGTATAAQRSGQNWLRAHKLPFLPRDVDRDLRLEQKGIPWAYMAQDFWVYHGIAKLPLGIDWFKLLFVRGATQDAVAEAMAFDEVYAEFIRNQVIDHNERFENELLPKCTLQEDLISAMITFPVDTTGLPERIGKTGPLNSTVVELDFQPDWEDKPATIAVKMLPDGTPQPEWFHWKVYHLPDGDCASRPANFPREYKEISPNLRYFVVLSNGEDEKEQAWEIMLE